jgi:hypothetical protein
MPREEGGYFPIEKGLYHDQNISLRQDASYKLPSLETGIGCAGKYLTPQGAYRRTPYRQWPSQIDARTITCSRIGDVNLHAWKSWWFSLTPAGIRDTAATLNVSSLSKVNSYLMIRRTRLCLDINTRIKYIIFNPLAKSGVVDSGLLLHPWRDTMRVRETQRKVT